LDLRQWCQLDEATYIAETDEEYKQYAGFNISINSFSDQRSLLIGAIEDIALFKTKKLELELHKTRNTKIVSSRHKFNDSLVNWSTWRQFNSLEKNDSNRKEVFDEFIGKRYISAIVEDRFSSIKQVYREYKDVKYRDTRSNGNKISHLSGYLEDENISYDKLLEFVKSIGDRAKKPFRYALNEISTRILGRNPEYYDDFYYFRNKVFSDMAISLLSIDPLVEVKKLLEYMEFETNKIHFDTENKKNKYPSPICFFAQIPDDFRVLYKKESPYFDLQGCFHETGHAIHANSIGKNNEYWDKYRIPMGITEIFSILLERLTKNGSYLRSLHWSGNNNVDGIVDELNLRNEFMELFFVTFYTANSLMKLEYWNKNLSLEESCSMYSVEVPGEYWLLHQILPEAIMYVPSYLLAAVRAAELDLYMRNTFGDKWWTEVQAGKELKEIMEPGAKIDLSKFSKLDSTIFVKEITRQI
jgi:Peptidase family M3